MRPLLLTLVLVSCGPVGELGAHREAIVGGVAEPDASTTFLLDLRFNNGASICSAVLISPRVLLTAAHCVDPVFHGASTVTVRAINKPDTVGLSMSDTTLVTVIKLHPSWNPQDTASRFDLALLALETAPPAVTPVPLARVLPANPVGQLVHVLGYGRTGTNASTSSGTRRGVSLPITSVTAAELAYGADNVSGICSGDSGGPSLFAGEVVGIHSRNPTTTCGRGVDIRVDVQRAFAEAFVAANDPPACVADGVCPLGCAATDPDCLCRADARCEPSCGATDPDCLCLSDGRCDPNCGGAGDPDCRCLADARCDASCGASDPDCLCLADGRCDSGCAGAGDPDCRCPADGRCEPGCNDVDCRADGASCTEGSSCEGAQCLEGECTRSCTMTAECAAASSCQAGVCRAAAVGCGAFPGAPGAVFLLLFVALGRRSAGRELHATCLPLPAQGRGSGERVRRRLFHATALMSALSRMVLEWPLSATSTIAWPSCRVLVTVPLKALSSGYIHVVKAYMRR